MIKNLRASSLKWLKTSKSMARIYKIKRKDTVSGTKKWHVLQRQQVLREQKNPVNNYMLII